MSKTNKRRLLTERPGESKYLDADFYARLHTISEDWREPGDPVEAKQLSEVIQLLYKECRLLDDQRFEDWLELFVKDCVYWIPGDISPQNASTELTWEIHDRRRLEDRVARLRTGTAYSQLPPTRTRHLLSNIEVWSPEEGELRARTNLTIHTFRQGVQQRGTNRVLACMSGYVLKKESNAWLIELKQINLIDPDSAQGNNSFFL